MILSRVLRILHFFLQLFPVFEIGKDVFVKAFIRELETERCEYVDDTVLERFRNDLPSDEIAVGGMRVLGRFEFEAVKGYRERLGFAG